MAFLTISLVFLSGLLLRKNLFMKQVEQIQADIEALSQNDFVRLREWLAEKDWLLWDEQLEADAADGKLDFLVEEAMQAKSQGQLQDLATGLISASNDA